ncbi:unnamed protein product [Lampetra fluviatilis]
MHRRVGDTAGDTAPLLSGLDHVDVNSSESTLYDPHRQPRGTSSSSSKRRTTNAKEEDQKQPLEVRFRHRRPPLPPPVLSASRGVDRGVWTGGGEERRTAAAAAVAAVVVVDGSRKRQQTKFLQLVETSL